MKKAAEILKEMGDNLKEMSTEKAMVIMAPIEINIQ